MGVQIVTRPREVRRTLVRRIVNRIVPPKPRWLEALRAFAPEVVLVSCGIHWEVLNELDLFGWLLGDRIPHAVLVHGNSERMVLNDAARATERTLLGAGRPLIFVSEGNRELAERQLARRFDDAVVLPNSVDRYDAPLPWPQGDPVFAIVGRLDVANKGHDILFRVLAEPRWRERRWVCRCFGDGRDETYVRELIRMYGLESRVELPGHVPDVSAIWPGSHLCVVPSRAEGTPLALLEALAAGRPAVVTDVGDNAAWTDEGETGFVAEAATPRSFGAAMERAWAARERWEAMGREAWARSSRRFDPNPGETLYELMIPATRAAKFSNEK
jgi:glycosyltransferase involved in cell wall biosynthesis